MSQEKRLVIAVMKNVSIVVRPFCVNGFFSAHSFDLLNSADDGIEEAAAFHFDFHRFAVDDRTADRRDDGGDDLEENEDERGNEQFRSDVLHLGKIDPGEREVQENVEKDIDDHTGKTGAV